MSCCLCLVLSEWIKSGLFAIGEIYATVPAFYLSLSTFSCSSACLSYDTHVVSEWKVVQKFDFVLICYKICDEQGRILDSLTLSLREPAAHTSVQA
ncbi:hypothetical protein KCU93_g469, partial [Aureobasidium melanogenum]